MGKKTEKGKESQQKQNVVDFMSIYNNNSKSAPKDSWDYLQMAYEADSEEDALKYAKKAFQLDKNCLDAEAMIADLTCESPDQLKAKYEKLIIKAETQLKKQELFDEENIGIFWGLVETRPYMRLRHAYIKLLIDQGKFRRAIKECEDLIRLSEHDNLGIRYLLMSLYVFFEDEINANQLYKKYHQENNSLMLLPMIALYYKLDNYKKAETYLKKLHAANDGLEEVFCNMDELNPEFMDEVINAGMYRHGSKEEVMIAMMDAHFLYSTTSGLLFWIAERLMRW